MVKAWINDEEADFPHGLTILQAAQKMGVEIPIFCYHERLSIAGNCRMCLVEVEGSPKPVASCATTLVKNMRISTTSPLAEKARKGVMEFLLINHPLDCPICDQAGECDLQDIAVSYGRGSSRFLLEKRAVPPKHMGPLIKTDMNRCIHCTRCVRFCSEVSGIAEVGSVFRGEHTEITTYLNQAITSELSGNLVDLCPVGALTSRPYAFKGRPWELAHTPTIDVMDALGSHIMVDSRSNAVMRIKPRTQDAINEEWLSDKSRFSYDGLQYQRLHQPYVRNTNGHLVPSTWEEAIQATARFLKSQPPSQIGALAGDLVDVESMGLLRGIFKTLGSPHLDCRQDGMTIGTGPRSSYLFNSTIAGIDEADFCLLVGSHPRHEAPLLNARIGRACRYGDLPVASLGNVHDLTYPVTCYAEGPTLLSHVMDSKHPLKECLKKSKKPLVIIGKKAFQRRDGMAIVAAAAHTLERIQGIRADWNGLNVLHSAASRVGGLDVGFVPGPQGKNTKDILESCHQGHIKGLYLLGSDDVDTDKLRHTFVIYQGHHGDRGAQVANIILPGAAYTEKDGTYVNLEGRVQRGYSACTPPGLAKEDWQILCHLSQALNVPLSKPTLEEVRRYITRINPVFSQVNQAPCTPWTSLGDGGPIENTPFENWGAFNFYQTDVISRHSVIMAQCQRSYQQSLEKKGDVLCG